MAVCDLASNQCIPCKGGVPPLKGDGLGALVAELGASWDCVDEHHLVRDYKVKGYGPAVAFANIVAGIADEQDHHPDILFSWGRINVTIWTHKIDGLTESDFYFAAKCEEAFDAMEANNAV